MLTKKIDQKIRGSDLVLNILDNKNINSLYCVPGDANLHLMDSMGRKENFNYYVFNDKANFSRSYKKSRGGQSPTQATT